MSSVSSSWSECVGGGLREAMPLAEEVAVLIELPSPDVDESPSSHFS